MDEDLAEMTRDHLITEVKKLRQGIREENRSCSRCSSVATIHGRVYQVSPVS
jgi:hypothetical protein